MLKHDIAPGVVSQAPEDGNWSLGLNRQDHRKIGARTGTQIYVTDGIAIRLRGDYVPWACNSKKNANNE
jgi:hypothetical protein